MAAERRKIKEALEGKLVYLGETETLLQFTLDSVLSSYE